ncbi:metal ABC transporter permease [Limnohabitans sp.]|uniref:metal ABC transporter permease n=1 Tax=Limnohabitans sp. TaxID=1907725 RepID=UPI00333FA3C5
MAMQAWLALPMLALLGGLLALSPLGSQVLRRGVVFIDLAVAQAAAAAVIGVHFVLDLESLGLDQLAASAGALGVSLAIAGITRRWPAQREALIGLLYVAGACLAMLGASAHPHGKEKLMQLLAADVLWVNSSSVLALMLCAVVMAVVRQTRWLAKDTAFYVLFALVTSLAVPALGLFLVFSCLIAPALWVERGMRHVTAVLAAWAAALTGLLLSWWLDTPSGPTIALSLTLWGVVSLWMAPKSLQQADPPKP